MTSQPEPREGQAGPSGVACRRDWVPSMFTGPGIDAIGPPIAIKDTYKVATRLGRTHSLALP